MTDPGSFHDKLETAAANLDEASKAVWSWQDELDAAEEEWLKVYDAVAEDLQREIDEDADRRGAPAEHIIVSVTRRQHRAVHTRWSRAKRAARSAEIVSSNRRSELTAYQSLLKSEMTETGAQDNLSQAPHANFQQGRRVA